MGNRRLMMSMALAVVTVLGVFGLAEAQVIPPKAQGTSQGGPTIDQV